MKSDATAAAPAPSSLWAAPPASGWRMTRPHAVTRYAPGGAQQRRGGGRHPRQRGLAVGRGRQIRIWPAEAAYMDTFRKLVNRPFVQERYTTT